MNNSFEGGEQILHNTYPNTDQTSSNNPEYIFFYGNNKFHGEFSNFYNCPKGFKVSAKDVLGIYFTRDYKDEIVVYNSEQAIMWFKAILMHNIQYIEECRFKM